MKNLNITWLLILFIIVVPFCSLAQRSNGLAVEGKISVEQGIVEGAEIQMFQDGKRLDNYGVGADGKYKVELNYGHKFELIFISKKNFQQKIVVDTNVPKKILESNPKFPPFPVNVFLYTEISGIDRTFSENTVLKLYYSENVDNFISQVYYNDAQIKKLIDQAIAQSQIIGRESDYLSKLTRAELAELKREYDKFLESAGKEYSNEKFLEALDGYKAASRIFPKEQFPKDRIAEINDLLGLIMAAGELDKALVARFELLIKEANLLFDKKQYEDARNSYNRALSIKPNDTFAIKRINEINEILKLQQQASDYNTIIAQADKLFQEGSYPESKRKFSDALKIKPTELYPKDKISEIDLILSKQIKDAENLANYQKTMTEAENLLTGKQYEKAMNTFQKALTYIPSDKTATGRIEEIKKILIDLDKKSAFDKIVLSADNFFKRKLYSEATNEYKKALEIIPAEIYPKDQINKINDLLNEQARLAKEKQNAEQARIAAEQAAKDKLYTDAIAKADGLFNQKDYTNSKNEYQNALKVKPAESYPQQRITEINNLISQMASAQKAYDDAISRADKEYKREAFDAAKSAYNEAIAAKPNEKYPAEMVAKIDSTTEARARIAKEKQNAEQARIAAEQAAKDKLYTDAIAKADGLFNQKDYTNSKNEYQNALKVKPAESYPQQRITEINNLISQMASAQKAYDDAISRADKEYKREAFDAAKSAYNEAIAAKPNEKYPAEMVAKIDSTTEARARLAKEKQNAEQARIAAEQAVKDKLYTDAIAKADGLFNQKDYTNSKNEYQNALKVKPAESYPQQRITEINNLISQQASAQKAYDDAISRADKEYKREAFDAAKSAYNEAIAAKPNEKYPAEMVAKIDSTTEAKARLAKEKQNAEQARIAAEQAVKDKLYTDAIAKADGLFNQKDYTNSKNEYQNALKVKPAESYPQQRITEINNLISQMASAQKAYDDAISRADKEYKREAFDAAKSAYNEAIAAKPNEKYPAEMVAKIDSTTEARARIAKEKQNAEQARIAAEQAAKDKLYTDAIAKADGLFNQKDYTNSKNEYQNALKVKPAESYPQQRITEINNLISQLATAQKAYDDAISRADKEYKREAFDAAKSAYNEAIAAKPNEKYPAEMVAKIDSTTEARARIAKEKQNAEQARIAAEQAAKDKLYTDAIAKADGLFNQKDYTNSKNEYQNALKVKPAESYPQQRITEINNLVSQQASAQKAYDDAIQNGDKQMNAKNYVDAKNIYTKALELRPNESYPKDKIRRIEEIIQQNNIEEDYRNVLLAADENFNSNAYPEAKSGYQRALEIKAEEQYPKIQIVKIDNILKAKQDKLITEQKKAEDLEKRKAELAVVNSENKKENVDLELNTLYQEFIRKADELFTRKEYLISRAWYYKAWDIKPRETYPPQRIAEINKIMNSLQTSQLERDYQKYINMADSMFRSNELAASRGWYSRALSLKSNETYPVDQISEIKKRIDERISGKSDELVKGYIKNGESSLQSGNLTIARYWFKKAAELRPENLEIKSKITEIEKNLKL